jgi:hypothetical protein
VLQIPVLNMFRLPDLESALMRRDDLLRQADNAERHADQAVDDELKETLRKAAEEYRKEANLPQQFQDQTATKRGTGLGISCGGIPRC